ncbi:glycosyltransferase family 9 protein [Aegicerativicinus sediminis]
MAKHTHILVIRFSAMGDVAMTYPVLKSLLQNYPELKITFLTRGFFKPIFSDLHQVEVFAADLKGRHKGIAGLYRLSRELKELNINAVADLHNVLRTKILRFFLKGNPFLQIDKGRQDKKELINGRIFKQLKTTSERYVDVFKELGFNFTLIPEIDVNRKPLPEAFLNVFPKKEKKWIGIAPFAAHVSKVYPIEQMKLVIDVLEKDYQIFLFGSPGDEALKLENISNKYTNVFNMAEKFNFGDELKIVSNLDVMVSMDSGNGHLAANFGIPVLTLWGVTHPYLGFAPYNKKINRGLMADRSSFPKIPTSVYGNRYPDGYETAISTIEPEQIIASARELLGQD